MQDSIRKSLRLIGIQLLASPLITGCVRTGRLVTSPLRLLPDFMIIGAQKCGTTFLYRLLNRHPYIVLSSRKEVHYFDNVGNNLRYGMNWYRSHFPTHFYRYYQRCFGRNFITGEASPYYIFHPSVPERVFQKVPKVKLIALLRDPVARAYSHYHHNVRNGFEQLTFEQAIGREEERLEREEERLKADTSYYSYNHVNYSYLSRGIYLRQLINWRRYFSEEQMLLIRSEDFFSNPAQIYSKILAFLGLPEWDIDEYSGSNSNGYPDMDPDTEKRLIVYFHPHNEKLYEFMGVDFGWRSP